MYAGGAQEMNGWTMSAYSGERDSSAIMMLDPYDDNLGWLIKGLPISKRAAILLNMAS